LTAVRALLNIRHEPLSRTDHGVFHLGLVVLTYDALNDDDDQIRLLASVMAGKLLYPTSLDQSSSRPIAPAIAVNELGRYMITHFRASRRLYIEALRRLLATSTFPPPPFERLLLQGRKSENMLFVQEKQNLYIDETKTALFWSRVLLNMDKAVYSSQSLQVLRSWVIPGLSTLIAATSEEFDGPLGWSTKPETFSLGMRLLFGAETVIKMESSNSAFSTVSNIINLLYDFFRAGQKNSINEHWLNTAERILEESMWYRFQERLSLVQSRLGMLF
jgi:hypothetical protein